MREAESYRGATAREAAARNVQAMTHSQQGIHWVKPQSQQQSSKPNNKTGNNKPSKPCSGWSHWRNDCPFKNDKRFSCDRKGHLSKFCFSKPKSDSSNVKPNFPNKFKNKPKPNNYVSQASAGNNYCESSGSSNTHESYDDFIFHSNASNCNSSTKPIIMTAELAGVPVQLEVDKGAGSSLLSKTNYYSLRGKSKRPKLLPPTQQLQVCEGGGQLNIIGEIKVPMILKNEFSTNTEASKLARFVVAECTNVQGLTLFGRDNLSLFKMLPFSFCSVNVIKDDAFTKGLANKFPDLFSDGFGCYRDYEATFDINREEFPKFYLSSHSTLCYEAKIRYSFG